MRTTSSIHATAKGKDLIVSFALDVPGDPYGGESLTLQRTPVYESFLPPEERGVSFSWKSHEIRMLAEVRWGEGSVELADRGGWRMEINLRETRQAEIDRAMAVLERMNFDGTLRISGGTAPVATKQQLLMEALGSEDPGELRDSIRNAQNARELLTEPFLDLLGRLTPAIADVGNVPSLAIYFLAAWRETRALEPLVRYFEQGGEEAHEVLGDIVVQDLPSILRSVVDGRFDLVRRLVENENVDEWVRAMAIETLVSAAVAGELPVEEVEAYLQELMTTRLARDGSYVWAQLASSTLDLASQQLLPHVEQAYTEGLIEEGFITLREVRKGVRGGRERAFAESRKERSAFLIDDVVEATSWWELFSERAGSARTAEEREDFESDRFADLDRFTDPDDFPLPGDLYEPVQQVIRATPKTGRNDPCPCGSGKKYKKCCGG